MAPYTLYYHPYSICSLMVCYTLALANAGASVGADTEADSEMDVSEEIVDILRGEQLKETFLEMNPKGLVPVLNSPTLSSPVPDSLAITLLICEHYPALLPSQPKEDIIRLLNDLHAISYFSLSFSNGAAVAQANIRAIQELLGREHISEKYRKALEYKLSITTDTKLAHTESTFFANNKAKAASLLKTLDSLLPTTSQSSTSETWLFGLPSPTALDAHLVIFIARLMDVGHVDIVPEGLLVYANRAWEGEAYKGVMQGRKTMVGV